MRTLRIFAGVVAVTRRTLRVVVAVILFLLYNIQHEIYHYEDPSVLLSVREP